MHFQAISEPLSDILLTSPDFGFIMLNKKRPDSVDNPLFRRQFELFAVEIHVVFALNGDQMNVCMGHFEA